MFSCKFCEAFKRSYFVEQLWTFATVVYSNEFAKISLNTFENKHVAKIRTSE